MNIQIETLENVRRERDSLKKDLDQEQRRLKQTVQEKSTVVSELLGTKSKLQSSTVRVDELSLQLRQKKESESRLLAEQEKIKRENEQLKKMQQEQALALQSAQRKSEENTLKLQRLLQDLAQEKQQKMQLEESHVQLQDKYEDTCTRLNKVPGLFSQFQQGMTQLGFLNPQMPSMEVDPPTLDPLPPKKRLLERHKDKESSQKTSNGGMFAKKRDITETYLEKEVEDQRSGEKQKQQRTLAPGKNVQEPNDSGFEAPVLK